MKNTHFRSLYEEKRTRERFSPEQILQMEDLFKRTPTPTSEEKESMAKSLNTSKKRIQVWFQNRRSKSKRHGQPKSVAGTSTGAVDQTTVKEPLQKPVSHATYSDPDYFSSGNLSTISVIRPSNRPTALLYQPTYSQENYFNDYDTSQQYQNYSAALFLHHPNQQQHQTSTRTLPPPNNPHHSTPAISLFPQGPFTPLFWRTSIFDSHHQTGITSNAPIILSHETHQPRHAQPNPLNSATKI